MRKEIPSKIVINPRPPAANENETSAQDNIIVPKSAAPPAPMPPAPPAPEDGPKPAPLKKPAIDKKKLPRKPIPKK